MIFSELYSAYYNAMAKILASAIHHPLKKDELREIVEEYAFEESILNIEPALVEQRWQLIKPDGTTPVRKEPDMPLTLLQKRWLKAISLDPRIRLFQDELLDFPGVEPLFTPDDYLVFDKYADGDDYADESYRTNFRLILEAIHGQYPISIEMESHKGNRMHIVLLPRYLEYSEKDDKFRVVGSGKRYPVTVNLGRIQKCEKYQKSYTANIGQAKKQIAEKRSMVFELVDKRNALERALLHFAHFEKQAERLGDGRYQVTIHYEKDDETEIVIRVLSFGPMIKVTSPPEFTDLIKERLKKQKSCGL